MARGPQHSSGWGGRREGSGRKRGGINRLALDAIERASKYKLHPVDWLMRIVNDPSQPTKERTNAAAAVLPYVSSKLSFSEINLSAELAEVATEDLVLQAQSLDILLKPYLQAQRKALTNGAANGHIHVLEGEAVRQ